MVHNKREGGDRLGVLLRPPAATAPLLVKCQGGQTYKSEVPFLVCAHVIPFGQI